MPGLLLGALLLAPLAAVAGVDDNPAADGEARELLEETLRSRGGIEEMGRLAEVRRQGELVMATAQGEHRMPLLVVARPPHEMIFETGEGEEHVRREVTAGKGWETRGGGSRQELTGEQTARLLGLALVDEAFLVHSVLAGDLEISGVEDAGPGQVDPLLPAAAGRAVLLRSADGSRYRLVVPEGGGLPLRVDYDATGPSGEEQHFSEVFARWRIVDGLLFPAEIILFQGAQALSATRYETISVVLAPVPAP